MENISQVLDQNVLFQIGIILDLPDLINLCKSNKEIDRKLCQQDAIWNYRLKKDFGEYLDFQDRYPKFKPIFKKSKREYYTFLYKLNKIKTVWNLKYNLYRLYYLSTINLGENNIETIPKEIGVLHNLQGLDLADNHIRNIPKEIEKLHNLRVLDLSNNEIESIPKEIGQLHNLEILYLSKNKIREIPKKIVQLHNLQRLYLANESIEVIPKEIGQLNTLRELALDNNKIKEIPKEIGQLHNLQYLYLSYNPIVNKAEVKRWIKERIPNIKIDI
jgi:hypothetical protein